MKISVDIGNEFGTKIGKTVMVGDLVSIIVSNAVAISGVILLLLLIFGGISMIVGAGQQDPQKAAKGKSAATAAVIGFLIIFGAYWITQIVEAMTGVKILSPGI